MMPIHKLPSAPDHRSSLGGVFGLRQELAEQRQQELLGSRSAQADLQRQLSAVTAEEQRLASSVAAASSDAKVQEAARKAAEAAAARMEGELERMRVKLAGVEAEGERRVAEHRGVVERLRAEKEGLLRSQRELQESVGRHVPEQLLLPVCGAVCSQTSPPLPSPCSGSTCDSAPAGHRYAFIRRCWAGGVTGRAVKVPGSP